MTERSPTFTLKEIRGTNLGVILRIPGVQSDGLQVQPTVKVDSGNDVLEGGDDALDSGDVLLFESERNWCRRNGC